jgi:hypothetical protein
MNWNNVATVPVLGQYMLMEDHEGNWTVGIYTGQFTKMEGLPPFGIVCKWISIDFTSDGKFWTNEGCLIEDCLIFGVDA